MKTIFISICLLVEIVLMTSCGSFGQGFLYGMSGYGGYGSYGGGYGSNMNYLLDPNYAAAQTIAQQSQYNQFFSSTVEQTAKQTLAKEEQEYQEFAKYNKKSDGSNYTKNEWRTMQGQAIQQMNNSSSYSTPSKETPQSDDVPETSSPRKCMKLHTSDNAHCNGTGVCSTCNGKGRYYDTSFGNGHWVNPCVTCNGNGKCPSCKGTGYRQ